MAASEYYSWSSILLSVLAAAVLSLQDSKAQVTLPVLSPVDGYEEVDDTFATGPGLDGKSAFSPSSRDQSKARPSQDSSKT